MTAKVRSLQPPMVFDGLHEAIKNIRIRKGIQQSEAAERGGLEKAGPSRWSEYETRKKRLGKEELKIVTTGLGCTELDLWEEKVRVERRHYRELGKTIAESAPGYDTSAMASYVESLYRLDVDDLPPSEQVWFNDFRNLVVAQVSSTFSMADRLKVRYRQLMTKKPEDAV